MCVTSTRLDSPDGNGRRQLSLGKRARLGRLDWAKRGPSPGHNSNQGPGRGHKVLGAAGGGIDEASHAPANANACGGARHHPQLTTGLPRGRKWSFAGPYLLGPGRAPFHQAAPMPACVEPLGTCHARRATERRAARKAGVRRCPWPVAERARPLGPNGAHRGGGRPGAPRRGHTIGPHTPRPGSPFESSDPFAVSTALSRLARGCRGGSGRASADAIDQRTLPDRPTSSPPPRPRDGYPMG